jgi:hypothetical protein
MGLKVTEVAGEAQWINIALGGFAAIVGNTIRFSILKNHLDVFANKLLFESLQVPEYR